MQRERYTVKGKIREISSKRGKGYLVYYDDKIV